MLRGGYNGKILRVDLTKGKAKEVKINEKLCRKFLGGVGFASKIIFDEVGYWVEPLSPENRLVIAVGPFQGTGILGSGRWVFCSKSPLTSIWADSTAGGYCGREFKRAGFDAMVIQGRAPKPIYLWIHDGEVEFKDATHLWGLDGFETEDFIKGELEDPKVRVAPIGQAGENLVKVAAIIAEKGHGCAGRCGMGAIMGSKNLKAITLRGTSGVPIAEPDKLKEIKDRLLTLIKEAGFTKTNREHGQPVVVVPREQNALLPMKNWAQDRWPEGAKKIGAPRYTKALQAKPSPCADCIMGCHRHIKVMEDMVGYPENYTFEGYGPEYETLAMLGSNLLIDDLKAIVRANELCNRYGMDTISVGGLLGFAFECFEHGLITTEDTGGIELKWGNAEAMIAMVEKIGKREDFGSVLAEGIRAAAEKIGNGASKYAFHVKGLDIAGHDPRAFFGEAVETVTSTRGACHIRGFPEAAALGVLLPEVGIDEVVNRFEWKNKGYIAAKYQDYMQIHNSLVWCFSYISSGVTLTDQIELLSAITGWNNLTPAKVMTIGERITNLQRAFNVRMGIRKEDDVLPQRFFTPHKEGGAANKIPPMALMMSEYYKTRGWRNGIPTKDKLIELGLEVVAKKLYEQKGVNLPPLELRHRKYE